MFQWGSLGLGQWEHRYWQLFFEFWVGTFGSVLGGIVGELFWGNYVGELFWENYYSGPHLRCWRDSARACARLGYVGAIVRSRDPFRASGEFKVYTDITQ